MNGAITFACFVSIIVGIVFWLGFMIGRKSMERRLKLDGASIDELMAKVKQYGEECGALIHQNYGQNMHPPADRRAAWDAVKACAERLTRAPAPAPQRK